MSANSRSGQQSSNRDGYGLRAEGLLVPLRWVVVATAALITAFTDSVPPILWILVLTAGCYNLAATFLLRKYTAFPWFTYLSPLVNGSLAVTGVLLSGGLDSPFQPGIILVLAAIALRQPRPASLVMSGTLLTTFVVGEFTLFAPPDAVHIGRLLVHCLFYYTLVLMITSFGGTEKRLQLQLLQVAAHELRNPMAGLKAILSLLRRRIDSRGITPDTIPMLITAEQELDRLSHLVNDLADAYIANQGRLLMKIDNVNLSALVEKVVEPFRIGATERSITLTVDDRQLWVLGDVHRLQEVVRNLVDNAVKYTRADGEIRVSLQLVGNRALLSVVDNGIGIPADHLSRVFDRFHRIRNTKSTDPGGMGLGLYICREIVRQHNGHIWVESEPEKGSTFHVELPCVAVEPSSTISS